VSYGVINYNFAYFDELTVALLFKDKVCQNVRKFQENRRV
tara:strand:+ start:557 stop:676 length:120 start_codon:yes stop_codon:yes gene_type:complete